MLIITIFRSLIFTSLLVFCVESFRFNIPKQFRNPFSSFLNKYSENSSPIPKKILIISATLAAAALSFTSSTNPVYADDIIPPLNEISAVVENPEAVAETPKPVVPPKTAAQLQNANVDIGSLKVPYGHENVQIKDYLGKATIVSNMKLDDPQTPTQYPVLIEVFKTYEKDGLRLLIFPTEQVK